MFRKLKDIVVNDDDEEFCDEYNDKDKDDWLESNESVEDEDDDDVTDDAEDDDEEDVITVPTLPTLSLASLVYSSS